MKTCVYN